MPKRYPAAVHDFVKEHVEGISNRDLAALVNAEFGTNFTESSMKRYIGNHKLYRKKRVEYRKEVAVFIRENHVGIGPTQMAAVLNETFGTSYTKKQLTDYYKNHNLNSGLTGRFEKGHVPWIKGKKWDEYMSPEVQLRCLETTFKKKHIPKNQMEIGSITKTTDGYMIIKVSMEGGQWDRWALLHRVVWEKHNGPIPEGMIVGFKDGNKENCDIENLMLITMGENAQMNLRGMRFEDAEKTETGLMVAKMYQAVNKRRKNLRLQN